MDEGLSRVARLAREKVLNRNPNCSRSKKLNVASGLQIKDSGAKCKADNLARISPMMCFAIVPKRPLL